MKYLLFLTVFLVMVGFSYQNPPIPKLSQSGYIFGYRNASVILEMYVDLTCPDSAAAYEGIMEARKYYRDDQVALIMHLHSLPYHRASFLFAQGTHVVAKENESIVGKWIQLSFDNKENFYDYKILNKTNTEVIDTMADLALSLGVSKDAFLRGMKNRNMELHAKYEWKVGSSRGVFETPSYFINGVLLTKTDFHWKLNDWRKIIDPLL